MATKKISEVLGNLLTPYLAKYLPLSGGDINGSLSASEYKYRATQKYCYSYFPYLGENGDGAVFAMYFKGLSGNTAANARFLISDGGIYTGANDPVNLGTYYNRWPMIYGKDGDFSGNLTVKSINGVSATSLVSLDDLKEVLSKEQVATLEAKVAKRIALADIPMQKADNQSENGGGNSQSLRVLEIILTALCLGKEVRYGN